MKRKKGFTLIELLAVIVVLAIVAVIAIPLVMNTIESSKRGVFKESVRGLLAASEIANTKNEFQGTNYEIVEGVVNPALEYKGNTKDFNGRFYTSNEGLGYAMISNGKYCAYKLGNDKDITVVDGDIETCKETILAYDSTGGGLICPTCIVPTGDATTSDVKEGVTFWNANTGKEEVGTMSTTNGIIPEGWELKIGTLTEISGGSGTVSYDNTKYIPLVLRVSVNLGWRENSPGNVTYGLVGTTTAVSGTFESLTPMTSYSAGQGSVNADLNLLRLTDINNLKTATGIRFSVSTHSVSWSCSMWLEKIN